MTRRVVLVVFPGFQSLDLTGPMEVFASARRLRPGAYTTEVVAPTPAPVVSSSGLGIMPDRSLSGCRGAIDTLVVVGGAGEDQARRDVALIRWLRAAAGRSRRVASVCTGAFLLAEAGWLDGRRATTHWASCERLASEFPSVEVEPDRVFVRDEPVWTSAGVTAGMDLALALLEDDLDAEAARTVAKWLVMFVQRPGGQAQFSAQLTAQQPSRAVLRDLATWIADHLEGDLAVPVLAARSGMSVRNFARAFRAEMGATPAAYVESVRIEAARRLLESTDRGVADVARACGFGTVETLHRSFRRRLGVTPGEYRHHFSPAVPA